VSPTRDPTEPTVADLSAVHEVVAEHPRTEPGVRDPGALDAAVRTAVDGPAGGGRPAVAARLCRLVVANHPFVDGNKRTGLRALVLTFELAGGSLRYGADLESLVRLLAVDARMVALTHAADYLDQQSTEGEAPDEGILTDPERRAAFVRERTREDIDAHRGLYDRLADS
jgi:death-on-curing protein